MACDPDFSDVVLLLPTEGPFGSLVFPDQSDAAQIVTPTGDAIVDDGIVPFPGTFSIELLPDVPAQLEVTDAVTLNFSTGDWTVEFFYRRTFGSDSFFLTKTNFDTRFPYLFSIGFDGSVHIESADTIGTTIQSRDSTAPIPDDTWTHVVYERNGADFRFYLGGLEQLGGTLTAPYAGDLGDNGAPVRFVGPPGGTESIWLAQVRFTKGIARYAAGDFVPPADPFGFACDVTVCDPDFDNVILLLPFTGADGSAVFTDLSDQANVVTAHDGAVLTTSTFQFEPSSVDLQGAPFLSAYLSLPAVQNGPMDIFAGGDFTIEGWFRAADVSLFGIIFDYGDFILTDSGIRLYTNGATTVLQASFFHGWGDIDNNVEPIVNNTWTHFAVVRQGSVGELYLNGVGSGNPAINWSPADQATNLNGVLLGASSNSAVQSSFLHGQLDEIRVTKGVARYTANFVPPAAPFGLSCVVPPVEDISVPNIVDKSLGDATEILGFVGLILGSQLLTFSSKPIGTILSQLPLVGTLVALGSAVNVTVSKGPPQTVVPDIEGNTAGAANSKILIATMRVGRAFFVVDPTKPIGRVTRQSIPAGTSVPEGTTLSYAINVFILPFDVNTTVISQYANSPTILRLVENMAEYIDPRTNMEAFYQFVWNVDTAVGFGLDIWGRIVGVTRLLQIPGADPIVGFDNVDVPPDWRPMSEGRFAREGEVTTAYTLPDDGYRVLILTKALANIAATTAPSLNQLLKNLFPGRGRAFVRDLGGMAMQFVFNFRLTTVEFAILTQSGVMPHPAGVLYSVIMIPGGLFGFQGYTGALPFNFGVFNSRP